MGQDFFLIHTADFAEFQNFALGFARRAQCFGAGAFQRIQQRRHRQLTLAVDTDVDDVLAVEFEIEPRTAIRNNARREQVFAAAVGLALVVVEEHAGGAVHLRHDHAFGAVDDERAVVGHQGHVAHVNRLFFNVADRARAGVLVEVPHDQAQNNFQRRGERHAALDAFLDVVFRLFQFVIDELEPAAASEIVDREDRFEHFLQPGMRPVVGVDVHLQERLVRRALHVDQIGHRCHFGDAAEALANELAPGKRHRDRVHRLSCLLSSWTEGNFGSSGIRYGDGNPAIPARVPVIRSGAPEGCQTGRGWLGRVTSPPRWHRPLPTSS